MEDFLSKSPGLADSLGAVDIVTAVHIPASAPGDVFWSHKVRPTLRESFNGLSCCLWGMEVAAGGTFFMQVSQNTLLV